MEVIQLRAGGFCSQVRLWGRQDREPVFLLHDGMFGADASTAWENVAPRLADRHFIVAPDLLGFGGSDKLVFFDRPPYAPRLDQLEALYEALALRGPCHVVGTSFGGSLALRALERGRLPLASIVSISGTGGPWRTAEGMAALNDYPRPDPDAMARLLRLVVGPFAGFDELARRRYENTLRPGHFESILAMSLRSPAAAPRPADPYPGTLATRTTPVLLVAGEQDTLLESAWTNRLAAYLGASPVERVVLPTGHCPNIDHPERTAALVGAFLDRCRRDA